MSTKKNKEDTLAKFFNIDSPEIQELTITNGSIHLEEELPKTPLHPTLGIAEPAEKNELDQKWKEIQAFYRGGGAKYDKKEIKGLAPVLLSAYRENEYVSKDFPIWISGNFSNNSTTKCISLDDLLHNIINEFASDEKEARILKENVIRIVAHSSEVLAKTGKSQEALPIVLEAISKLKSKIEINGDESNVFNENVEQLKSNFPQNGYLIPFNEKTVYEIFNRILCDEVTSKSTEMLERADYLKGKLQDLLTVEKEKDTGDQLTSNLKSSIGFADALINLDEMSSVNPASGSELMSPERVKRIKSIIKTISEGGSLFEKNATLLFHKELYSDKNLKLKSIFNNSTVIEFLDKNGCEEAVKYYNENIVSYEKLISALRVAQLEVDGNYIDEIHDEYFSSFEWRMFTEEEMACFPPIILISELNTLVSDELSNFSKLLSQNIPIKVVSLRRDSLEGDDKNGSSVDTSHFVFRQELAAIAVAHRNTYVLQSATISPQYLFQGFTEGLSHFSPAIFNIFCPSGVNYKSPYMWGSATVESRDFPQFIYNGNLTSQWGSRFDVSNNPQTDANWPSHDINIITSEGEEEGWNLPFTFADYCFINASYASHFLLVDTKYWNDKLIPLSDYLSLSESDIPSKVPFIWVVDTNNGLQKVAVSFSIVLACKERLDFWDYLQENAGIHNYHVDEAVERERNNFKSIAEEEISKVKEELNKEIEKVREETTEEAMEKLTSFLLDMDDLSLVSAKGDNKIEKEEEVTTELIIEEEIKEIEDEIVTEEPWIETSSCTTCNECTDINDRMFSYNADKMAYMADPKAGTFKELVDAAVLCPVGIIHPGKPLNTNEPDLDELMKIAKEYN